MIAPIGCLVCISVYVAGVAGFPPPLPHCDQLYNDQVIELLSDRNDSDVRYLGYAQSTADCKQKCQNINYICDASETNPNNYVYKDMPTKTALTFYSDACELEIEEIHGQLGSFMLLTPNFAASEYKIELNATLLWKDMASACGLAFGASWSDLPFLWAATRGNDPGKLVTGYFDSGTSNNGVEDTTNLIGGANIAKDIEHTLSVHRQPNGYWAVSVNGVYQQTSSEPVTYPDDYVGVFARHARMRARSLTVTFPSSVDEMLCAAYMYDRSNGACLAYYGDEYAAMYDTLASDSSFDAGIIEYNECPVSVTASPTPPPTSTSSTTTAAPTTKGPTLSPNSDSPTINAPTSNEPTTNRPSTTTSTTGHPTSSPSVDQSTSSLVTTVVVSTSTTASTTTTTTTTHHPHTTHLSESTSSSDTEADSSESETRNSNSNSSGGQNSELVLLLSIGVPLLVLIPFVLIVAVIKTRENDNPKECAADDVDVGPQQQDAQPANRVLSISELQSMERTRVQNGMVVDIQREESQMEAGEQSVRGSDEGVANSLRPTPVFAATITPGVNDHEEEFEVMGDGYITQE